MRTEAATPQPTRPSPRRTQTAQVVLGQQLQERAGVVDGGGAHDERPHVVRRGAGLVLTIGQPTAGPVRSRNEGGHRGPGATRARPRVAG